MNNSANMSRSKMRGRLLASASTVSLIAAVLGAAPAFAAGGDAPVTLQLSWQPDNGRYSASNTDLPLGPMAPLSGLTEPLIYKLQPFHSNDIESRISFRPDNSDWSFSAAVRYGRSSGKSQINQALPGTLATSLVTYQVTYPFFPSSNKRRVIHAGAVKDQLNVNMSNAETHLIVDFDAGKDVGLGMFGRDSKSNLNIGVRFAHFAQSRQVDNLHETNNIHFQTTSYETFTWPGYWTRRSEFWDTISATGRVSESFTGLGPSLQWDASAELWHDPRGGGGLSFDLGANAALLFGRQKKSIQHQTTSAQHCAHNSNRCLAPLSSQTTGDRVRASRTATVPNIGGFAGVSLHYPNVKVSLGYRADLFVNALDVGAVTHKSSDLFFHGPFASISIGIGGSDD